jgi:hypothetical protein
MQLMHHILTNVVAIKSINNYLRKSCPALAQKINEIDPLSPSKNK